MPVSSKRITIDGFEYEFTMLGALEGRRIWLKLLQVASAPIKNLSGADSLSALTVAGALGAAIESLDDATAEQLYEALAKRCRVREGENWPELAGAVFDQHFAGRYLSMSKWLLEGIRFNFASFLGDRPLGSIIAAAVNAVASPSNSQKGSTGKSGASLPTSEHP